ncbi:MAG: hypothetical protein QG654_563 [Patescibacteria group bacterium]|nr:hypothetical protein [Patescibacteria group bacterium]
MREQKKIRAALFIDGRYLTIINNYYRYVSNHKKKFDIISLIKSIHKLTSGSMSKSQEEIAFLHKHLYIGILDQEQQHFNLEEGAEYLKAGITCHTSRVIKREDGKLSEKGVDTSLTIDAFELVALDEIDVLVIVAGDADFVPLVLKTKKYMKDVFLFYWDIHLSSDHRQNISTSGKLIGEVNTSAKGVITERAINMGHVIEKRRLKVFHEETSRATYLDEVPSPLDQIARREQGRVAGKRGRSIFISPGTGGDELEYKTIGLLEAEHLFVGRMVEYNIRNGLVVDLRITDA